MPRRVLQVLLLIETSRAYGRGLVEGIARYAEENAPWSILFEERGLTDPLPRWFKQWRGDGILSRTHRKANLTRLRVSGVPVVELYAGPQSGAPCVYQDEAAVAQLALEHFWDRGFRHYAFFASDGDFWIQQRRQAFARAVAERDLTCHHFGPPTAPASATRLPDERRLRRWLRGLPKPCGIFCASDFYAMRLVRACRAGGLLVPEQIAVLGVDNDPVFCATSAPRLSSIDLGSERIGYEAARLLARLMAGQAAPAGGVSVSPLRVLTRESTDLLALEDEELARAVRLIRQQGCGPLRVAEVAARLGLSRRVLETRFRQTLHRSPKEEILRVRMERAKLLLGTTELAVAQVAKRCGFTSLEYFIRAFRRRQGQTPRSYRQQVRGEDGSP